MKGVFFPHRRTWVSVCAAALMSVTLASCGHSGDYVPPQVIHLGLNVDSPTGAVMVRRGDTVSHIAERYRLNIRDIIDYNRLSPPYHLAENQRLLLPPPAEHKVGANDTMMRVARMYGVSASELVRLNNISPPYTLQTGQVLRLPPSFERTRTEDVVAPAVTPPQTEMPPQPVPQAAQKTLSATGKAAPAKTSDRPLTQAATTPKPATAQKPKVTTADKARTLTQKVTGGAAPHFGWPVKGNVISVYGPKEGGLYNEGLNIAAPRGSTVKASAAGTVVYVGNDLRSYGNMVLIRHTQGYVTAYAHLEQFQVARGATVTAGQAIGTVGNTGTVAQPQLHFEVRKGNQTLDPQRYIKG